MSSYTYWLGGDDPTDEQIWHLHAANSSLRISLIVLIIFVIIFAIVQFIKLIYQIRVIHNSTKEISKCEVPKVVVYPNKKVSKEIKRRSKHSFPSKEMKIELSLIKKSGEDIISDSQLVAKKMIKKQPGKDISPERKETEQKLTKEKLGKKEPSKELKDGQNANVAIEEAKNAGEAILQPVVPKDSLASWDNKPLIPTSDVKGPQQQLTSGPERIATKIKPLAFSTAEPQDSLMVVNLQGGLQPAGSTEQTQISPASSFKKTETTGESDDSVNVNTDDNPAE